MAHKIVEGQRFGSLTVMQRVENVGSSRCYLCKCECGAEVIKRSGRLVKAKTCGCGLIPGQRFGKLTVVARIESTSEGRMFLCKCECGNKVETSLFKLNSARIRSCGCLIKEASHRFANTAGNKYIFVDAQDYIKNLLEVDKRRQLKKASKQPR